jgi:predicted nucleic acid-binding protein
VSALYDTSVLVGVEQGRLSAEQLLDDGAVSVVTVEELWLGVLRTPASLQPLRRRTYEQTLGLYDLLEVTTEVARACAEIRAEGRRRSVRYAPFDSLIGATARVNGLPLLTQDEGMLGMLGVDVRVL